METTENKTTAMLLQLSAYAQYIFPFGNFILPVLIWSAKKDQSKFVDYNGKQAINFQLSVLVYTIAMVIIAVPIFAYTLFNGTDFSVWCESNWSFKAEVIRGAKITGIVMLGIAATMIAFVLKVTEFILILIAAVKNGNGDNYNFPLTIKFIK
jgi:uncharacterized protein